MKVDMLLVPIPMSVTASSSEQSIVSRESMVITLVVASGRRLFPSPVFNQISGYMVPDLVELNGFFFWLISILKGYHHLVPWTGDSNCPCRIRERLPPMLLHCLWKEFVFFHLKVTVCVVLNQVFSHHFPNSV
ncbi:hypothetical protein M5689_017935 [Euphorbia peplus]|nr:hypothetical protein M5689_017935 [Euphorbia peplus]